MDKAREQHTKEMERLRIAMSKTKSKYLRRDYSKALRRMETELKDYDRFKARTPR